MPDTSPKSLSHSVAQRRRLLRPLQRVRARRDRKRGWPTSCAQFRFTRRHVRRRRHRSGPRRRDSGGRIKSAFERNGTAIFWSAPRPTTWWGTARDLARYVRKPKYQADALRHTIIDLVGAETRIGDLKHPVIVPAVNLTKGRPQVFKTPHHADFRTDLHLKVVDVSLATSAAPTYFRLLRSATRSTPMEASTPIRRTSSRCTRPSISSGGPR